MFDRACVALATVILGVPPVVLLSQDAVVVEVRVLDPNGQPMAGARVTAEVLQTDVARGVEYVTERVGPGVSDAVGWARLEVPRGRLRIRAVRHGLFRASAELEIVGPDRTTLRMVAPRGSPVWRRLSGRVVDANGRPAAGVEVRASRGGRVPRGVTLDPVRSEPDGSFRFDYVPESAYRIDVTDQDAGYGTTCSRVVAGRPLSPLTIELAPWGSITGSIHGARTAVSALQVVAVRDATEQVPAQLDAGGYRFQQLRAGRWAVTVDGAFFAEPARAFVNVEAGGAQRLDIDLSGQRELEPTSSLRGSVTFNGTPSDDVRVSIDSAEDWAGRAWRPPGGPGFGPGGGAPVERGDGRYAIRDIVAGDYYLRAGIDGFGKTHEQRVRVAGDTQIDVNVVAARVRGLVVNAVDGTPLPDAELWLGEPDHWESTSSHAYHDVIALGEGATFDIGPLDVGTWTILARARGFVPAEIELPVTGSGTVDGFRVALLPTPGLQMIVHPVRGRRPSWIQAQLRDGSGATVASARGLEIDPEGRVHWQDAPPGQWTLRASGNYGWISRSVHIPGDPVSLEFSAAGNVRAQVPALFGASLASTTHLLDGSGNAVAALAYGGVPTFAWPEWWGLSGQSILWRVPPGDYLVRVTAADGRTWERSTRVQTFEFTDVWLRDDALTDDPLQGTRWGERRLVFDPASNSCRSGY